MSQSRSRELLTRLRNLPGSVPSFWRRSLRTRVVTAIVVLCAVVVGSVGALVMRQISGGLVKSRVEASVAEARTETATARERLLRQHADACRAVEASIDGGATPSETTMTSGATG